MREKIFTSRDLSGIAPPILVMGYMHSGTTLLQHMMGNHPSIFIAFEETSHFAYLENTKRQFPDLKNEQTLREYLYYLILVVYEGYQRVNFSMDGPMGL